jgi:hypothetical protein
MILMREIAKWAGIVWMVAVAIGGGVLGAFETGESRPLLLPATGGLGEQTLLVAVLCPGYLLYCWGVRRAP